MTPNRNETLKYLLLLLMVVVPLSSLGFSNHGLWSADEPRVAEIGREMAVTGNWAVPTLNRKPFLEEPPLYYAALAVTFKAFGVSDKVARIPSALFGFGTVLILFFMANAFFGPRTAFFSGLVLATGGEYFRVAHWIVVDSALTFFVMCAMALFAAAYLSQNGKKKLLYYVLFYVSCTLAFYAKGFIGIVIPGLGIIAFLMVRRDFREIIRMRLWLGVLVFLTMTLPWCLALWQQGGYEHLKVFLFHNHLQRFLPASMAGAISESASGHHHAFYYYITEFPSGFLPWSILLIPVLLHAFGKSGASDREDVSAKGALLAKCWFFAGLLFLSMASTKRTLYLMPIFAPFSMLTARYIASTFTVSPLNRIGKIFLWVFDVLLLLIGASLTPVYFYVTSTHLIDPPAGLLAHVVTVSVVVTVISLAGALYLYRDNLKGYWASVSLPTVLVLIFTMIVVVPIIDKKKSFIPFCDQITALVPANLPLYAYIPDETLRGAVPFYTGRFPVEIADLGTDLLAQKEPLFVAIRDKRGKTEEELLRLGTLFPIVRHVMGSDRTLVLFSNRAPERPLPPGKPDPSLRSPR